MPGTGPPPSDATRLVGHGGAKARDAAMRTIKVEPSPQPELPDFTVQVEQDGTLVEQKFIWPQITRDWWDMWGNHPTAPEFSASDWSFLMDTARLHAQFWSGDAKAAAELRLRVAKFGATPEDRARLRIQFAIANQKDSGDGGPPKGGSTGRARPRLVS